MQNINLEYIAESTAELAKLTGAYLMAESMAFSRNSIEFKEKNNPVSFVDKKAEQRLVEGLSKILPEAGFLVEEQTVGASDADWQWIVDPLDGTCNFIHGLPIFCVSIGLMFQGRMKVGVVFEANNSELFCAWERGGAYLNGVKINVSPIDHLGDALVATGFPYAHFEHLDNYLEVLKYLMQNTHGIRRLGTAALDLAYVACGRFDGYFEYNLNAWDVAAGALIVQEAGGSITDFNGERDYIFGRSLVCGSFGVQSDLLKVIKKYMVNGVS